MTIFDALKDGEEYEIELCTTGKPHRYEYFDTVAIEDEEGSWIDEIIVCRDCGVKSHGKRRIL